MLNKVYKYTLTENETFAGYANGWQDVVFKTTKGNLLLTIKDGLITIHAGYSWDGCTPKVKVFGKIIGTPDGNHDETKRASLLHDALYQAKHALKWSDTIRVSRKLVDDYFYIELVYAKWKYAKLYYRTVRALGWIYWNN